MVPRGWSRGVGRRAWRQEGPRVWRGGERDLMITPPHPRRNLSWSEGQASESFIPKLFCEKFILKFARKRQLVWFGSVLIENDGLVNARTPHSRTRTIGDLQQAATQGAPHLGPNPPAQQQRFTPSPNSAFTPIRPGGGSPARPPRPLAPRGYQQVRLGKH